MRHAKIACKFLSGNCDGHVLHQCEQQLIQFPVHDVQSGMTRRRMSAAVTEWVKAPTEIRSTPARAYSRIFSSVMPPDDSRGIRPPHCDTALRVCSGVKLSSRMILAFAS